MKQVPSLLLVVLLFVSQFLVARDCEVLMIVTSIDQLTYQNAKIPTGCWAEELIEPYILFTQSGYRVTIASPRGGIVPFDPAGLNPQLVGEKEVGRYREILKNNPNLSVSTPIAPITRASHFPYEVVFLVGGHGTVADFFNNPEMAELLHRAYDNKCIFAAVCHGLVGLLNLDGTFACKGACVTGFSDTEENQIQMTPVVKSYLGDTLATLLNKMTQYEGKGGYICQGEWQSHTVNYDNRIITGQNPASSKPLALEVIRVVDLLSQNKVKASIQKGYPVFGPFVTIGHPTVVEVLGLAGVDFIWIEGEHAALSLPQILSMNIATSETSTVPIVRVPSNNPDVIKQYVDTGAMGIIIPYIKTAGDARKAVRALKYPPQGERGIGLGRSTGYFIKLKEYLANANRDIMVIPMIETQESVDNIEQILQVPGLDLLVIGPFDLSASMGYIGQPGHPEVIKAIAKVEDAAMRAKIPLGISVPDKKTAYSRMNRGYRFFVIGADVEYLFKSAKNFLEPKVSIGQAQRDWEIAENIKFHYAYLEPSLFSQVKIDTWETPGIAPFSKEYRPDIANIGLPAILNLHFPLPTMPQPDQYKFYLKFYHYPKTLDAQVTARKILPPYLLHRMKGYERICKFIDDPNNIYIKMGFVGRHDQVFEESNPFPPLRIPVQPIRVGSTSIPPQNAFDNAIPFSSLYITTNGNKPQGISDAEFVAWTTKGLLSFHRELIDIYKKYLLEVPGKAAEEYYYFIDPSYVVDTSKMTQFTLIKLPKHPMSFVENFKDLPMPHDPKLIFLSGLLLVYKTTCFTSLDYNFWQNLIVDGEDFKKHTIEAGTELLEVVSVVQFEAEKNMRK